MEHGDFTINNDKYASDEEIKQFLDIYKNECCKLKGETFLNDSKNCIEHLLLETKLGSLLVRALFMCCMVRPNKYPSGAVPAEMADFVDPVKILVSER